MYMYVRMYKPVSDSSTVAHKNKHSHNNYYYVSLETSDYAEHACMQTYMYIRTYLRNIFASDAHTYVRNCVHVHVCQLRCCNSLLYSVYTDLKYTQVHTHIRTIEVHTKSEVV